MAVGARVAAILLLVTWAAAPATAQDGRVFQGSERWRRPGTAPATESELLFDDRSAGGFQSRSFYFTAYLEGGVHLEISVFRWEYGPFGGWVV